MLLSIIIDFSVVEPVICLAIVLFNSTLLNDIALLRFRKYALILE